MWGEEQKKKALIRYSLLRDVADSAGDERSRNASLIQKPKLHFQLGFFGLICERQGFKPLNFIPGNFFKNNFFCHFSVLWDLITN
jgi:hypothetical protein